MWCQNSSSCWISPCCARSPPWCLMSTNEYPFSSHLNATSHRRCPCFHRFRCCLTDWLAPLVLVVIDFAGKFQLVTDPLPCRQSFHRKSVRLWFCCHSRCYLHIVIADPLGQSGLAETELKVSPRYPQGILTHKVFSPKLSPRHPHKVSSRYPQDIHKIYSQCILKVSPRYPQLYTGTLVILNPQAILKVSSHYPDGQGAPRISKGATDNFFSCLHVFLALAFHEYNPSSCTVTRAAYL